MRAAHVLLLSLLASSCGGPPSPRGARGGPPPRTLVLGAVARGDTRDPDALAMSSCKGGGRAGQALDHLYGFEVREAGSFRFTLVPETFQGVIQVQAKDRDKPWYFGIGCAAANAGKEASLAIALEPGFYHVVVDGYMWDEAGPYTLNVARDTGKGAMIRPEDREIVSPLCESAEIVRPGNRFYGVYHSTSGGALASCGLLGGDAVGRLSLDAGKQARVRVAAHFRPAVEIRRGCQGEVVACAAAPEGRTDVDLEVDLAAGEHFIVVSSMELRERSRYGSTTGAVAGAYVIDVDEVTR